MLIKESMIEQRAEEVIHAEIHNHKYKKFLNKSCEIQELMEQLVPENKRDEYSRLSESLSDVNTRRTDIELKLTYKQGFYDGLEIAAILLRKGK